MPLHGRRLMVQILEEEASRHPSHPFAIVSKSDDAVRGFYEVTFQQMKNAVDHVVHLLQTAYSIFSSKETLAYIGVLDLRYNILCYAAWKCRMKVSLAPSRQDREDTNSRPDLSPFPQKPACCQRLAVRATSM